MYKVKINKKGQVTIPKAIRDKYGLVKGITLAVIDYDMEIKFTPAVFCHHCKKVLTDEFEDTRACPTCPPMERIVVY